MAIVVEDGTGKADAEALCDVAYFKAYCNGRGLAITGLADERIEQLLREATEFAAGLYGPVLQGSRAVAAQALDWPRKGVAAHGQAVPADVVPKAYKDGIARLAHKAIAGPLVRDLKPTATRVKVGPIEKETDPSGPQVTRYVDVGRLVAPYLKPYNPFAVNLERA